MPRNSAFAIENNFSKGLVTEASGLNYPENSCIETWNCVFDPRGSVTRRLGIDFEFGAETRTIDKTGCAISVYHWKNVTGDGLTSLLVLQVGPTLYFYDTANLTSLSAGEITDTIDLSAHESGTTPCDGYECQFTSGLGKLFVAHPFLENIYVTYDVGTQAVTSTEYSMTIRDFEGVEDGYAIDERKTETLAAMSDSHEYNLRNQGWDTTRLTAWDTGLTTMPSNCDVWWTFKNSSDAFDTATVANGARGNTPAAKGHFIQSLYLQDRDASAGTTGVADTTSGEARTSVIAWFAGRLFYSGINAEKYNSKIYYSQIIERDSQFGQCYQQNDPTSEDLFDLYPSDGGVISIPEAGTIYKLFPMAGALVVFAYHGIWLITGSSGIGFTANDYTVAKISSVRTVSASSFVDVNGVPMWWNTDGIFTLEGQGQSFTPKNISIDTIQTFYNSISNNSKTTAKGYFNPLEQTVQWLYSSSNPGEIEEQYIFDRMLNLNLVTGSFAPWSIATTNPAIHGLVVIDGVGGIIVTNNVVADNGDNVQDDAANDVISYQLENSSITPTIKYIISYPDAGTKFTFADANNDEYIDWNSYDPLDYDSYFITGYKIHGDGARKFQSNYVNIYQEGIGSFYVQGIWDYALSTNQGRYSNAQLCDFTDNDYANASKRLKIRGHGKSLQYYVRSVSGEPFNVIGWSAFETGNTAV